MRTDNVQRAGAKKDMETIVKPEDPPDFLIVQVPNLNNRIINDEHYFSFLLRRSPRSSDLFSQQLAQDMAVPATSVPSKRTFKISELLSDNLLKILTGEF